MESTKTEVKNCVHYWVIDNENRGKCKKCGSKREFKAVSQYTRTVHQNRIPKRVMEDIDIDG